jgi:hypothetical protein
MKPSAKYDYYPIPPATGSRPVASLMELAINVVTDWMPGVPNSLALGFSGLLGEMLKVEEVDGDDLWIVGPRMIGFEKQWKLVTSWILGVAFSRKVIEALGYPWWAPVSAFSSSSRSTSTPYWTFDLPPSDCAIERRNASILFPDYVLARAKPGGSGYAISFAESKGCKASLEKLAVAPADWKSQSENAKFIFRGTSLPITQYLLIATRVYPLGKRPKTRRIQVRAWNSTAPDAMVPFAAFRDVVVAHYFGVCERISLPANAHLLALRNYTPEEDDQRKRVLEVTARLLGTARQELRREQVGEVWVYFGPRESRFKVGEMTIRIGLSEPAVKLVQGLQQPQQRDDEGLIQLFDREIAATRRLLGSEENFFLRNDGVIGVWVNRESPSGSEEQHFAEHP